MLYFVQSPENILTSFIIHCQKDFYFITTIIIALREKCPFRSFSGQYFSVFVLNTERYRASLRIQSKCGKRRTRKTLNTDTFHVVPQLEGYLGLCRTAVNSFMHNVEKRSNILWQSCVVNTARFLSMFLTLWQK